MGNIKTSSARNQLNYDNDLFFKYTPSREDEGSIYARSTIIERITGIRVEESTVLNPNLDPGIIKKKRIILDVHARDRQDRHFNIEMQTTCKGIAEVMRFEFCGARTLNNQPKSGEFYDQLKPVYQTIFTDEHAWNNRNLINQYQIRNEQEGDESGYPPILRTFIRMPVINNIVKGEGIQRLNDFEQSVYLFENNEESDILKSKEKLVRVFINKYEGIRKDNELWSTVMAIQMGEVRYRNGLRGSSDEGKAVRKMEGERQFLYGQMQTKFHEDCAAWLQTLTGEQMQVVSTLLLERDTFGSLGKRLHKSDKK